MNLAVDVGAIAAAALLGPLTGLDRDLLTAISKRDGIHDLEDTIALDLLSEKTFRD